MDMMWRCAMLAVFHVAVQCRIALRGGSSTPLRTTVTAFKALMLQRVLRRGARHALSSAAARRCPQPAAASLVGWRWLSPSLQLPCPTAGSRRR